MAKGFFETGPRPLLRWVCLIGAAWGMGLCDLCGFPMDATTRGVVLAFVAAVYGLRGWEKIKAASEPEPYAYTYPEPDYYRQRGAI